MNTLRSLLKRGAAAAGSLVIVLSAAHAQTTDTANPSITLTRASAPEWLPPAYRHALHSPLPSTVTLGTPPPVIPQFELFPDIAGQMGNYQPAGPVPTATNAFFQPLGTNGRSCVTCHQPSNSLSVSTPYIRALFAASMGRDPLFAPVDGANCPNRVPAAETAGAPVGGLIGSPTLNDLRQAHSLLLDRGLFRIFLPVPKQTTDSNPHPTEYTIELISDPNGCNADPAYNQEIDPITGEVTQIVSVYRRPLITANLKFKTMTEANFPGSGVAPINFGTGDPLPIDPFTGQFESLHIMWDGREPTLQSQASDAVLIHSQAMTPPTAEQVAQIVAFENGVFTAQEYFGFTPLSHDATGGSRALSALPLPSGPPLIPIGPVFNEFDVWNSLTPTTLTEEQKASISRGQNLFNTVSFPLLAGQPILTGCTGCHSQFGAGSDRDAGVIHNTGVGGQSVASNGPAPDPALPIFKLTCSAGVRAGTDGPVVVTNDPGLALITGRCADIGISNVPTLRGLAARAPYFHNGSAATVRDIVEFYDKRFTIGFTEEQKQDLTNFLESL